MGSVPLAFGEWPSPLSPMGAARSAPRFGDLAISTGADGSARVWFSELSDGRNAVWTRDDLGLREVPQVVSARSRLNEYGGGALWVDSAAVYWVEDEDQMVRRLAHGGAEATVLTPEPPVDRAWRYAGGVAVPPGGSGPRWVVCERQRLVGDDGEELDEAINDIVAVRCEPASPVGPPVVLVEGRDFLAAPTVSADGRRLAWLSWDHPDMPWESAELWAGELRGGEHPEVVGARRLAGGRDDVDSAGLGRPVSVCLPGFEPDGELFFCDDRDDRWVLRRVPPPEVPTDGMAERAASAWDGGGEVGEPRWVAGGSRYGFMDRDRVLLAETIDGLDSLRVIESDGRAAAGPLEVTWVEKLVCSGAWMAAVVGRADRLTTVVLARSGGDDADADDADGAAWESSELKPSRPELPEASISPPVPFDFLTTGEVTAHGLFHAPRLEGVEGPPGERPPLVVRIHGGPTAHARAELSTSVQFWTTRGFAVAEVNYRGSSGYGRRYRDLLDGGWGVAEVQDCLAAARHLAAEGLVDPRRCVIRGGSAGGFTALEAVCAEPAADGFGFAAATSLYGVTDLAALATDTHKFEARYLDGLIGPLPEARERYRQRSPLHHAERISAPVLLLQGSDDAVVPPAQAEVLVEAMQANGLDHEYRVYEGEGHGFRRTETVADALEAELRFYGRVLGFRPAPPEGRSEAIRASG